MKRLDILPDRLEAEERDPLSLSNIQKDWISRILSGKENNNIIELGAGWGRLCMESCEVADCWCIAVEAEPTHYEWCTEHFRLNEIKGTVIWAAVSSRNGYCYFDARQDPRECYGQQIETPKHLGIGTLNHIKHRIKGDTLKVPMVTIDSLVDRHIDLIMMDIQGAEYDAILGARQSIGSGLIDYFMINTHSNKLGTKIKEHLSPLYDCLADLPKSAKDGLQVYRYTGTRS